MKERDHAFVITDWSSLPGAIEVREFGSNSATFGAKGRSRNMQPVPSVISSDVVNAVNEERLEELRRAQLAAASIAKDPGHPGWFARIAAAVSNQFSTDRPEAPAKPAKQIQAPQPR